MSLIENDTQVDMSTAGLVGEQHRKVDSYYRATDFDYRTIWRSHRNRARHFGFHYRGWLDHHRAVDRASANLADAGGIEAGTRVLDCGCGLGGTALWLGRNRGAQVTGIDLLAYQIASANAVARRSGCADKVSFVCGDATQTGFPDASFDVILMQEALCHLPCKAAFYREAYRLLAPGGRLVVAEYMLRDGTTSPREADIVRRWCAGWAMPELWTSKEHAEAAGSCGFGTVEIHDESPAVEASLRRLHRFCLLLGPLNAAMHALGVRSALTQANIEASRLQYEAFRDGLWIYGKLVARR